MFILWITNQVYYQKILKTTDICCDASFEAKIRIDLV